MEEQTKIMNESGAQITDGNNLQRESSTSLLIGYVLVLATIFVAFEWTQRDVTMPPVVDDSPIYDMVVDDMIPVTRQEQPVQAPPPAAAPQTPEILEVVDNNVELPQEEMATTEEVNQAIVTTSTGTGVPTAIIAGPPAPVVEEVEDETIHDVPGQSAEFAEGNVYEWIHKNMKYPNSCREEGIQGRVSVQFVVNRDGSIVDIKVQRSPHPDFDTEVIRLIKAMPKWKPARNAGKPVRQRMSLPITFRLQ